MAVGVKTVHLKESRRAWEYASEKWVVQKLTIIEVM